LNASELFRSALRSLRAHKLRSFLTLLGMIISVAAIVAVVSIISGLNQSVRSEIMFLSPDMFIVTRFGLITSRKEWLDALKRPKVTVDDYARLRAADLPSVAEVGAGGDASRIVSNGAKKLEGASIIGCTANTLNILNVSLEEGRMFSDAEENANSYVALIGADIRDELFGQQDPIGRNVLVSGLPFRVVGFMPKKGASFMGGNSWDTNVYIPFSVYRKNFAPPRADIEIYVKARSMDLVERAKDEVRTFIRTMRHTDFRAPDPFGIVSQETIMEFWEKISAATFLFITLISGVSLFVGGIVIMNIMLVSVAERTQEIGIRMALGARKRDILRQFLLEAAMLSVVGGIIGFGVGAGIALGVKGATGFPAQVTPSTVFLAIGLATLVGLLAGFFPARRAANLVVIDAIRAE
jgi:putative ABC transport system permease protein